MNHTQLPPLASPAPGLRDAALALVRTVCEQALVHDFSTPVDMRSTGTAAFLLAVAADALDDQRYGARALELMDDALARLDLGNHALFDGASGLVWMAAEIDALLGMNEYGALASDYDETLGDKLSAQGAWPGHYELINGLAGLGTYAFARRLDGHGGPLLELVLAHLGRMATPTDEGCCWVTTRAMTPAGWKWPLAADESLIDLGIAHGNAGVITLLAAIVEQFPDLAPARPLLSSALAWYEAQRRPDPAVGVFPYRIGDTSVTRGAWCYGDFSAAWMILSAGRALQDPRLDGFGLELLRRASARTPESLQLHDPWLCHGHAGLAHVTRRAAHAHQDRGLMAVADRYLATSIDMTGALMQRGPVPWSLLEGLAGNSLSYLDACGLTRRRWDRPLLIS
jgi:hypothetical protein